MIIVKFENGSEILSITGVDHKKQVHRTNTVLDHNKDSNIITFSKPSSLKSIYYGIVEYGDYPYSVFLEDIELKIQEVYSNAMIMTEKDNGEVIYFYNVEENKCYKVG